MVDLKLRLFSRLGTGLLCSDLVESKICINLIVLTNMDFTRIISNQRQRFVETGFGIMTLKNY